MSEHFGRAWSGHTIEDDCPCHQASCGLVDEIDQDCPQHSWLACKSMRQGHFTADCPGVSDD